MKIFKITFMLILCLFSSNLFAKDCGTVRSDPTYSEMRNAGGAHAVAIDVAKTNGCSSVVVRIRTIDTHAHYRIQVTKSPNGQYQSELLTRKRKKDKDDNGSRSSREKEEEEARKRRQKEEEKNQKKYKEHKEYEEKRRKECLYNRDCR